MRLDPAEAHRLPLRAAVLDHTGYLVARTPEWEEAVPGSRLYQAGHGYLSVAPAGERSRPELDQVIELLLATLDEARTVMDPETALRAAVLTAGLRLVAGRPLPASDQGTSDQVMAIASAALAARADHLEVEWQEPVPIRVPAPAVIALALVQFAVNAAEHEFHDEARQKRVQTVRLRAEPGPSLYVEWPSERPFSEHRPHPSPTAMAQALGARLRPPGRRRARRFGDPAGRDQPGPKGRLLQPWRAEVDPAAGRLREG